MKFRFVTFIIVIVLFQICCQNEEPTTQTKNNFDEFTVSYDEIQIANRDSFELIPLPYEKRPSSTPKQRFADEVKKPRDTDDIELFYYRDQVSYHPVFMSQRIREFLNMYMYNKDEKYLKRAEKYANKLIELAVVKNGSKYGINTFRYAVHTDSSITFERFFPSGMVQGEMLCVFSRLYGITGNDKYLNFANEIFPSFFKVKRNHDFWTVRIDENNYYWVEEYPHDIRPGMTLNGFNYALFGIYEYYLITGREEAKDIYDLMLTTLLQYLPQFLESEEKSYYCLGHKVTATDGYHVLHYQQLQEIHRITNNKRFLDYHNRFKERFNVDKK